MNCQLQLFTIEDLNFVLSKRIGEQRVGEVINLPAINWEDVLIQSDVKFVLLGIPEDIGVRANYGIGGTHTAWDSFLKIFLNTQHSAFCPSEQILLLGKINITNALNTDIDTLRQQTAMIDDSIFPIIQSIVSMGKIPIVIGGGHNNAFPILKGTSLALGKKINTINLDAHADFRALEGRHSGNGFSYAYHQNYLGKYAALGLQQVFNNQSMVEQFASNNDLYCIYWEDIFLAEKYNWEQSINHALSFVSDEDYGVELDLDTIENVLSSAISPIGITVQQALKYIYLCGNNKNACYLHLPEGVAQRDDGLTYPLIGKLLTYLALAFIKARN